MRKVSRSEIAESKVGWAVNKGDQENVDTWGEVLMG